MANEIQNRWAFLVGVNHYREGRRFHRLNHCINDVLTLQQLLKTVGYGVVCLHDQLDQNDERYPDTANTVVAEFRRLCQKMGPDDLLLVYFACHGTRQLVNGDQKPYLIFRETRSTLPETALSIADFKQEMANSPAQRQVMLLDACHMGMGTDQRSGDTTAERQFIRNVYELATGFALLAASTAQQTAKESTEIEHGVFSNFVLSGLAGQGKALVSDTDPQKRFVSVDSLRKHVFHELLIWSAEKGYDQTPQGHAEGDLGEFILVDYRHQDLPELAASLPSSDVTEMEVTAKPVQEVLRERGQPEPVSRGVKSHGCEQITTQNNSVPVSKKIGLGQQLKVERIKQQIQVKKEQIEREKALLGGVKGVAEYETEHTLNRLADDISRLEAELEELLNV